MMHIQTFTGFIKRFGRDCQGFLINKKTVLIMKKKTKKSKDKTPYDPDSSHHFIFFEMV
jgi:hypothetical protein